jgi:glycosyltransferase involved in cell wall biosynthesis
MNPTPPIKASDCLVVIPAMNEEKSIGEVVRDVVAKGFDVLVVDDDSKDATADVAHRHGAKILPLLFNLGAWNATQAGIRYAVKHGYEYAISMDADGQHSAESLTELTEAINKDHDVVIAACTERGSLGRKITWAFFKKIAGFNIDDLTSGFRIYNHAAMLVIASRQATLLEYQDVGVLLLLNQHHLSIAEIETSMFCRISGKSRIFSSWLQVFYYMMYTSLLSISKINPIQRLTPKYRLVPKIRLNLKRRNQS